MSKFSLANITVGRERRPLKMVVYGVDGVGKSTFASMAPNPIFITTEDGAGNLDVAKFPLAETWKDLFDAVETLYNEDHKFETVVLDSIDHAETLCWEAVCADHQVDGIEALGYGKGYKYGREKFIKLLRAIDALWLKGMQVVVIGHSKVKRFDDPAVPEPYERHTLKMDEQNEARLREWAECVLFASYDTTVKTIGEGPGAAKRGVSYGKRVLYTERAAAYDAKNRYGLPPRLALDFNTFWNAYQEAIKPQTKSEAD